ncbi:hypothetical protein ACQ856_30275 (plasmid) [Mycolicibacterium psychrotolerans]|uniref:hypothetical protein n=1 Tax=Mycolicibacterium psychrotolerans TaxID=216929 RepID=UPI003D667471
MLDRVAVNVERRWLQALVFISVVASVYFLTFGLYVGWGSSEWGSYGQCVGSAFTLAAVVVALREASRGRGESLKAQRSRLIDHELTRRRENLDALADLWAALMGINMAALRIRNYFDNLPARFNPNLPRPDQDPDATEEPLAFEVGAQFATYVARWVETVEPPLFRALAMLKGSPLYQPLKDLNQLLTDYKNVELPKLTATLGVGRRPDTTSVGEAWRAILAVRQAHLDLAQDHFSLNLEDVEAALATPPESPTPEDGAQG